MIADMSATAETVAVPPEARRYTYDELLAEFPESNVPCELWDGEVIMPPAPSFSHQENTLSFYRSLYDWVKERQLGKVIAALIDMVLSPHRVTQPDVAFIAKDRLNIVQRPIMGPADLVAEIFSLGGQRRDRIDKKDLYAQQNFGTFSAIAGAASAKLTNAIADRVEATHT